MGQECGCACVHSCVTRGRGGRGWGQARESGSTCVCMRASTGTMLPPLPPRSPFHLHLGLPLPPPLPPPLPSGPNSPLPLLPDCSPLRLPFHPCRPLRRLLLPHPPPRPPTCQSRCTLTPHLSSPFTLPATTTSTTMPARCPPLLGGMGERVWGTVRTCMQSRGRAGVRAGVSAYDRSVQASVRAYV